MKSRKNLLESLRDNSIIKSFPITNNFQCILQCSKYPICSMAIVDISVCKIYIKNEFKHSNIIYSSTSTIYSKDSDDNINQYLIHYWPFNGNYDDVISNANLFNGSNDELVTDRFGRPSSSLYLNYGSLQGPSGHYIYGDFTLTTWVKVYALESCRRFLMLKSQIDGLITFSLTLNSSQPYFFHKNGNQVANMSLVIGKWQHLAWTNQGSTHSIYVDGMLAYNGPTTPITVKNRTNVYFGTDQAHFVRAEFDDIKIFNRSLSQIEIARSSLIYL